MNEIPEMEVDPRILTTQFACDLGVCRGACCTFPGGAGAPVAADEVDVLHRAWNALKHRVPVEHRQLVERDGLIERIGSTLHLRCYNERACVFVEWDGPIARCAIQNAWFEGSFDWVKPLSCHLFPIRVGGKNRSTLRFEHFQECAPAHERGRASGTLLVDFLEDALTRAFGPAGHARLRDAALAATEE